jgi:hypothetical protein
VRYLFWYVNYREFTSVDHRVARSFDPPGEIDCENKARHSRAEVRKMSIRNVRLSCLAVIGILLVASILFAGNSSGEAQGQKLAKSVYIQATAMGQLTQLGKTFSITAIVKEFSPPEDQRILLEAFQAKGNEGLVNALEKMPSKGRLSITGTLGGDLAYIRRFEQPDGSIVIRMITNRLLRFNEVWADTRSSDYQLSGLEVIFSKDKKKKTGTLIPAAQLHIDKKGQMEIEAFQNPWTLTNIMIR